MKRIAGMLFTTLTVTAVLFFLLYKKEILFTLGLLEIEEFSFITENKDYCHRKFKDYTIIEKCGGTTKTVNAVFLPGFSPQGAEHRTLSRFASALVFSELSNRVIIFEIPSLSKTPEWNPEKTEKEIQQAFDSLRKKWDIDEKKLSVYSVCGSSSAYLKVLAEGHVPTPKKIIFYTPYYSYKSLLLSVPADKSDSHIQSIIYYNAEPNASKEDKEKIAQYFQNSKPGDDSDNAKKYLGMHLFQKIQSFRTTENTFKNGNQFETKLPRGSDIEINIITSHSDYMPYSEAETLKSELQKNGNANTSIFYTDFNHANTVNFSLLELGRTWLTVLDFVKP